MNPLYLETQVTTARDCASFYFKDITPEYDGLTAPNGYDPTGANCIDPSDLDAASLVVTILSEPTVSYTIDLTDYIDPGTIPGVVQYEVVPADLSATTIEDGIYEFVYSVTDNDGQVFQRTCYVLNDCSICCSLDQKLKDLNTCGTCDKQNVRTTNMLYEAYMLRQKAHHLVSCHDFAGAQEILDYLSRLLDIKYCDNCNNS